MTITERGSMISQTVIIMALITTSPNINIISPGSRIIWKHDQTFTTEIQYFADTSGVYLCVAVKSF